MAWPCLRPWPALHGKRIYPVGSSCVASQPLTDSTVLKAEGERPTADLDTRLCLRFFGAVPFGTARFLASPPDRPSPTDRFSQQRRRRPEGRRRSRLVWNPNGVRSEEVACRRSFPQLRKNTSPREEGPKTQSAEDRAEQNKPSAREGKQTGLRRPCRSAVAIQKFGRGPTSPGAVTPERRTRIRKPGLGASGLFPGCSPPDAA